MCQLSESSAQEKKTLSHAQAWDAECTEVRDDGDLDAINVGCKKM